LSAVWTRLGRAYAAEPEDAGVGVGTRTQKVLMLLSVSALVGTGSWYRAAAEAKNETTPRQESAIRVFLDTRSNEDYIKTEIPFVNYVRDRAQAEVHVLVTSLPSGGDRTEHSILFTGQERFVGVNDTLSCVTKALDTQEYVRSEIVRIMKLGLIRYVSRTPQGEVIRISYPRETAPEEIVDKWNYWVFGVGADASFSGEESSESVDYSGALSADRVTEAWKIAFKVGTDYREARYDVGTEEVVSISRQSVIKGMVVKSLGEHWSVGGYADASKSLYYNLDVSVYAAPAVEFDVFPYSQATRRDLRFMYTIGYQFNRYEEETIYFVTEEDVLVQELSLDIDVKENWGTIGGNVTGSNYMHDFDLNRLTARISASWRVSEGVSVFGVSLPRRGATEEDILLKRRQLATQYQYGMSAGFSWQFGSKYANIVNPRFQVR
jgi:hypothetical protein